MNQNKSTDTSLSYLINSMPNTLEIKEFNCKGCKSFKWCSFPPVYANEQCPCMNCLVKGMCNNPCDAFKEFSQLCYVKQ